jgi:hypothetical protein
MEKPDFTPYKARPASVPTDEWNPAKTTLQGKARQSVEASEQFDLCEPDRISDNTMNLVLWHSCMGIDKA